MAKARRLKHLFGGAMRQAGIVAAAGVYALEHHVDRLADDHARARRLAEGLDAAGVPVDLEQVETNFVQVDVAPLGLDAGRGARAALASRASALSMTVAPDEAARGHASRRRRRGHRARDRADPARARSACPRLSDSGASCSRRSGRAAAERQRRASSAAARSSGARRSGSPTSSERRRGDARHAVRGRLDHEDVHGAVGHAAARRGQARPRRPALEAPARGRARDADAAADARARVRPAARAAGRGLGDARASPASEELLGRLERGRAGAAAGGARGTTRTSPTRCSATSSRGSPARRSATTCSERLLGPLGLERTTWGPGEPAALPYFVEPYSDVGAARAGARARRQGRRVGPLQHGRRPRALGLVPLRPGRVGARAVVGVRRCTT